MGRFLGHLCSPPLPPRRTLQSPVLVGSLPPEDAEVVDVAVALLPLLRMFASPPMSTFILPISITPVPSTTMISSPRFPLNSEPTRPLKLSLRLPPELFRNLRMEFCFAPRGSVGKVFRGIWPLSTSSRKLGPALLPAVSSRAKLLSLQQMMTSTRMLAQWWKKRPRPPTTLKWFSLNSF